MSPREADDARRRAQSACESGDWTSADQWFRQALAAAPESIETLSSYGAFLAERQQFRSAISFLTDALDRAVSAGDLEAKAVVLSQLAAVYRQLGEYGLARSFQRQVLTLRQEADAGDLLAWSTDALLADRIPLAESLAETAFVLAEDAGDVETAADCTGILGLIAARRGRLRSAISLLIQAIRRHDLVRDHSALGTDYANLAEVCGLIARYRWQNACLKRAGELFERAGMPASQQRIENRLRSGWPRDFGRDVSPDWN